MVSVADMVDAVLEDERVVAINLYFESIENVDRLSTVAEKAWLKGIPIVVLKVGITEAGARATTTHKAAIAGDAVVASALFRRLRFIEVESSNEAMETLKMLILTKRLKGRRVGFATSSGSYAAMGADMTERVGLELPALSPQRKDVLQPLMEPFVLPNNPLDLATAQFWSNDDQRRLFDAFLTSEFDIALQCMSFPVENTWEDESWYRSAKIYAEAARAANLPAVFVSSIHEGLPEKARQMLIELGVAPLQGFHDGMRAIAHAARYAEWTDDEFENMYLPKTPALLGTVMTINEAESKVLLQRAGILTPGGLIWENANVPDEIHYPVALKICDDNLLHKSDVDGARLNIYSQDELLKAREAMLTTIQGERCSSSRFLIEPMIENGIGELLIGIRRVPQIGLALTIAYGGFLAEILENSVTLLIPAKRRDIETALSSLKLFPVLNGWRGRQSADISASIDTIMDLCIFAEKWRETLLELEVNPLILLAEGQGTCAVDAVIRFVK